MSAHHEGRVVFDPQLTSLEHNPKQSCLTQRRPRIEKHQQSTKGTTGTQAFPMVLACLHRPQPRAPTFPDYHRGGCQPELESNPRELGAVSALTEGRKLGLLPGSKALAIQILSAIKRETDNVSISVFLPPSNSRSKSA